MVYLNTGDWPAAQSAYQNAMKLGEISVGAVDYGLYAYVRPLLVFLILGTWTLRVLFGIGGADCRAYLSGDPISKSVQLRQEFYQGIIQRYNRYS